MRKGKDSSEDNKEFFFKIRKASITMHGTIVAMHFYSQFESWQKRLQNVKSLS